MEAGGVWFSLPLTLWLVNVPMHTVPSVYLQDCPADSEDFRAQQCSAYNDVQYQGHYYEWVPLYNDPAAPCALKCHARGQSLVVELAPKVLDGTRCNADSLDMCISGICQVSHTCHTSLV